MGDSSQQSALPRKVLFIDSDKQLRRYVRASLVLQGIQSFEAETYQEGMRYLLSEQPDVIVLDCDLADVPCAERMRDIREWSNSPVIALSREDNDRHIVEALDAGAHDFVIKPFKMNVFLARIRVAYRCALEARDEIPQKVIDCGDLSIDVDAHECRIGSDRVDLTPREFEVLLLLARHKGKVLTHRFILERVWGPAHADDIEYVRVFIMQIRTKLEQGREPNFAIRTETGVGYRLEEVDQDHGLLPHLQ